MEKFMTQTNKDYNFLFMLDFQNEDDENDEGEISSDVYLIFITTQHPEQLIKYVDEMDSPEGQRFYTMIQNNEDYGVLDVGFCPDYLIMGLNSYEIELQDRGTVVENIKTFFINEGFKCVSIFEGREILDVDDDFRIAHTYLSAHDLQKLQSMR